MKWNSPKDPVPQFRAGRVKKGGGGWGGREDSAGSAIYF